ncbi:MAG: hypothetical protein KJZ83_23675 [Burkholderiaceae bacterium]|nr:hypothetical protein [Burkholderiaceae bacterium]
MHIQPLPRRTASSPGAGFKVFLQAIDSKQQLFVEKVCIGPPVEHWRGFLGDRANLPTVFSTGSVNDAEKLPYHGRLTGEVNVNSQCRTS